MKRTSANGESAPFTSPAVTAILIALVMVATRFVTGSELKVETDGGQLFVLISGAMVLGFLALYLVVADEAGWSLFGLYLLSIPIGLGLRRILKTRYPKDFGLD